MSLVMRLDDWPQADRQIWATLMRTGGPFDDPGALAHLRATSRGTLERGYGRWLGFLSHHEPQALREAPTERATLPRLRAWLQALDHTSPMSRLLFVDCLLRVLIPAAPDAGWQVHRRVRTHLKRMAGHGTPTRKQGRVLSGAVLLEAALNHATADADAASTPLQRARCQRNGAMVALLACVPIRRRAFTALELGPSLQVTGERVVITLSEDMTKIGIPWEARVPDLAADVLLRYLHQARPLLMARGGSRHGRVWVGDQGRPLSDEMVRLHILRTTAALTGRPITPHLFRDAAATTLARAAPGDAALIRPLLGHTSDRTAARHYIQAGSVEAGRAYAALIADRKGPRR